MYFEQGSYSYFILLISFLVLKAIINHKAYKILFSIKKKAAYIPICVLSIVTYEIF